MGAMDLIRRIPALRSLNAWRRARQVEGCYDRVVKKYDAVATVREFAQLWAARKFGDLDLSAKPRVLYCGTDPLQDFGGFIQSLEEHCDLRLLRRSGGVYGQDVKGVAWRENEAALSKMLRDLDVENWRPEIVIMQSMGLRFYPGDLISLKEEYGFAIINIGMDERQAYRLRMSEGVELGISGLNEAVDLALVTIPEAVRWYAADGVPAKYFPLASSADIYFPIPALPKIYDVGFIGTAYGQRLRLADAIASSGLRFQAYGHGWPTGTLPVERSNEFYNQCRVVLGAGYIGYSRRLINPKLRDFEVPLTARPYLTSYSTELTKLYCEDEEVLLYHNERDLMWKLKWVVENPIQAGQVAEAGYRRALSDHQYRHRFDVLFNQLLRGDLSVEFTR